MLVSRNAAGDVIRFGVSRPSLSHDGTRIAFSSASTNAHPADADSVSDVFVRDLVTGVTLLEELDAAVRLESASTTLGTCAHAGGVMRCELGAMPAGATARVTVKVTPTRQGFVSARATVQADQPDADAFDNAAAASTRVQPAAALSMLSDAPDPVRVREQLTYRAEVANAGPSTGAGEVVMDVPDAVRLLSVSAPGASFCPETSAAVRCSFSGIDSGQQATVTITVAPKRAGRLREGFALGQ